MRDPDRIDILLAQLRAAWVRNPDWRLAQLVVNAAGTSDPFHVEDDRMLDALTTLADASE